MTQPNLLEAARILATLQPTFITEAELQDEIARHLGEHGIDYMRERRLSDHGSRIDFHIPTAALAEAGADRSGIGVEVKIAGNAPTLTRQLERYAACDEVTSLIVVSTRSKHLRMPAEIGGKPLLVVSLIGLGL